MTQRQAPGELKILDGQAMLVFERIYSHAPAQVWQAITDPAQLKQWFMCSAKLEGRLGGTIELVSGPSRFASVGRILAWEPGALFEYEWRVPPRPELPKGENAVVRWELSPLDAGTKVRLTYTKLTPDTARGFVLGMHVFLERLEAQLGGAPLPEWMQSFQEAQKLYAARA